LTRWSGLSIIDAASLAKTELRHAKGVYRVVRRRLKNGRLVNNKIPTAVALQLLAVPNSNPKYFFWSGEGNEKSVAGHMTKDLKTVFIKAKIADGHPHRFRDTAAVELLKAGVDIRKVSKFLGHASVTTTEKYYAPWNKAQQDIMDDGNRRCAGHDGDAHLREGKRPSSRLRARLRNGQRDSAALSARTS